MGILNVTPDSFYDGGIYKDKKDILSKVEKMISEGATFIDIGGYSSRPKATHISEDEELKRVLPAIEIVLKEFPEALISVDTFRSKVAKKGIEAGAAMVNDISAGNLDENMLTTIASLKVPYIMMHMKGNPQTMSQQTKYQNLLKEVMFYFSEKIEKASRLGIVDLVIDPGFGFSKTIQQNYALLNNLDHFNILELPILVGVSRNR